MQTYKLLSGETITYESSPFLTRVRDAAADPGVSPDELLDLIYSEQNPILKSGVLPGRGVVTRAAFENPIYHIMLDLLEQKRLQQGALDQEVSSDAQFTMTVGEAAAALGISESAVRQAIYAKNLAARKIKNAWRIYPAGVEAYKVGNQGPAPERLLQIRLGAVDGLSCKVKSVEQLSDKVKDAGVTTGTLTCWRRIAVIIGGSSVEKVPGQKGYTFWDLTIGDYGAENESIEHDPFYVRGPFRVVRKIEHSREAVEAFKSFAPQ